MEEYSFIVLVDCGSCEELLGVIRGVCPGLAILPEPFMASIEVPDGTKEIEARRLTFKVQGFRRNSLNDAITKAFGDKPKGSCALHVRSGIEY